MISMKPTNIAGLTGYGAELYPLYFTGNDIRRQETFIRLRLLARDNLNSTPTKPSRNDKR